ncbi:hypothetical protein MKK68_00735 [Methylobacterium sp. E-016]|jgi:hypothetical protein|uniref:hypothetical protein n=1 Tax=Methylobacterium sp. E-016 TaxID=2836556 RepID=UPI001FBAE1F5|nr:hypothetical protein [Methylobacterium sp. E-016]MCJ2074189.1 hypothetical protein [Methylobacterium sp. E-016]
MTVRPSAAAFEPEKKCLGRVQSFDRYRRFVQEAWDILPDRVTMRVSDITLWISADLVQEPYQHGQIQSLDTVRKRSRSWCTASDIS